MFRTQPHPAIAFLAIMILSPFLLAAFLLALLADGALALLRWASR